MGRKKNIELSVSYVAYKEGSLGVDHQDTSLQLCHGRNWQAHSCPTDEEMKVEGKSGRVR